MALTEPHGGYNCTECHTPWPSLTAASECAVMDAVESRQNRAAQRRRHGRDTNIIRSTN